jgi:hypothetical protein
MTAADADAKIIAIMNETNKNRPARPDTLDRIKAVVAAVDPAELDASRVQSWTTSICVVAAWTPGVYGEQIKAYGFGLAKEIKERRA